MKTQFYGTALTEYWNKLAGDGYGHNWYTHPGGQADISHGLVDLKDLHFLRGRFKYDAHPGLPQCFSRLGDLLRVFKNDPVYQSFLNARRNGTPTDAPPGEPPIDGWCTCTKGRTDRHDHVIYGEQGPDGRYYYELGYVAGPGDLAWMEQCDRNYLARLLREGTLQHQEPDVWRLREMERAQNRDIGGWWHEKLQLPEPELRSQLDQSSATYQHWLEETALKVKQEAELKAKQEAELKAKAALEVKLKAKQEAELKAKAALETEKAKTAKRVLVTEICRCALCHKIMLDPVLAADGETYEREEIERWLLDHATSPKTSETLAHKNLLPNNATRRGIASFLQTYPELWQTDEIYTSENLMRHLLAAVEHRDLREIETIVKRDPRLLTRDLPGHRTLLQLALTASPEVLQLVINELGLERLRILPEIATDNGVTSFKTTALSLGSAGTRILIQALAWSKATVQEQFEEAIRANNAELVRVCLDLGELSAAVEAVNAGGATLLHRAIEANDVALAGRFLEFGANIETLAPPTNDTALLHAVRSNKPEVLALLLASHPKPNLAATDSVGNSALHLAFNLGFVDLIPLLVNAGADLEEKDTAGNTALLRAVRLDAEQRLDLVRLMLERAERPAAINATNSAGNTALHLAFNLGFVDLIPLLVNAGADLEVKDTTGNTALLRAVRLDTERRLGLVRLMLERAERPAAINATNSDGDNALHLVARLGDNPQVHELATLLLDSGIDGLVMNEQDKRPETVAIEARNRKLADLIARKNIDLAAIRVLQQSGAIATPALSPSQARPRFTISGLSPEDTIDFADLRYGADGYLGEGSFARVYRGTWRHGNVEREVAIKELVAPGLSPTAASELVSEASIMRQLRHINVLGLFGVCAEPGHYSLVMEYMPKGSLYAVLQSPESDTWNWTVKWNIALGVVRGVEHLHGHRPQILHRDLKSLNVLLDANNVPKLTDFGLSQVRTETLRTTAARPQNPAATGAAASPVAGTFAWMAPELISDLDAVYTKACDVFSCGVILWEIASRRTPWARPGRVITDQQIAVSVINGKRETIPEDTPPTYAAMIERCWEQRAESRPRIEEVTQELEQHRSEALPIPETYLCPITGEIMREPVMDRDGHTFERGAIEQWVRDHHNCPNSRVPLELTDLAPNRALRDLIEEFLTANPALRPASCSAAAPSPAAPAPQEGCLRKAGKVENSP